MRITTKLIDTNNAVYNYADGVLENAINKFMEQEYKHVSCQVDSIGLNCVVGQVENIDKKDSGEIFADIELLDTFEGRIYKELIKQGGNINFAISGYGDKDENGIINKFEITGVSVV